MAMKNNLKDNLKHINYLASNSLKCIECSSQMFKNTHCMVTGRLHKLKKDLQNIRLSMKNNIDFQLKLHLYS